MFLILYTILVEYYGFFFYYLGFMCHHNVFLLYDSIEGASQTIWNCVTHFAVTISFLLMVAFGLVGYATFGNLTQGTMVSFLKMDNTAYPTVICDINV